MSGSLNDIQSKNILVVGDIMLDTYFTGDIKRISPEAPVPVFKKDKERSVLGGAANVAANLDAAEQKVSIMSLIGNDSVGDELIERFNRIGINTDLLMRLNNRRTTIKTRFLAGNNQQVIRMDVEDALPIDKDLCEKMLSMLKEKIKNFDLILLSDYLKGLLTYDFTQGVINLANEANIPVIVDVKDPKIEKYKNAFLLKPNLNELRSLTGMKAQTDDEIIEAANFLRKQGNHKYILATCGSRGMVLASGDKNSSYFIKSVAQEVFDVTGAGDTTIAYLAACMVNGFEMRECVDIANTAAGIQVSKVGTSLVYWREIRSALSKKAVHVTQKILKGKALNEFRKTHEEQRVVFTNGCFDILHAGHVKYLREAAKLGEVLVVGLNSDASVKRLKGETRPVNNQDDRAEILCALGFVDYVVIFEEDTPLELIKIIQPDVLVKGGDYNRENVVGADFVMSRGGELFLIPFVEGKSTTNIIKKIEGMK